MAQLRLPDIKGTTPAEQIAQIRSYLHQLVSELQWALDTAQTGVSTTQVAPTASAQPSAQTSESGDVLYLIRAGDSKTLQQAQEYTNSAINTAITEALEASY